MFIYCTKCDDNVAPVLTLMPIAFPKFVLKDVNHPAVPKCTVMIKAICSKCKRRWAVKQTDEIIEEAREQAKVWEQAVLNALE